MSERSARVGVIILACFAMLGCEGHVRLALPACRLMNGPTGAIYDETVQCVSEKGAVLGEAKHVEGGRDSWSVFINGAYCESGEFISKAFALDCLRRHLRVVGAAEVKTTGPCSPVNTGDGNTFNLDCGAAK